MMGAVEEAFKKWDITGDGAISKYELHAALTQLGMSEAQVGPVTSRIVGCWFWISDSFHKFCFKVAIKMYFTTQCASWVMWSLTRGDLNVSHMFNFYVSQLHKSWVLCPPNYLNTKLAFVFRVEKPTLSPKLLMFFGGWKGLESLEKKISWILWESEWSHPYEESWQGFSFTVPSLVHWWRAAGSWKENFPKNLNLQSWQSVCWNVTLPDGASKILRVMLSQSSNHWCEIPFVNFW